MWGVKGGETRRKSLKPFFSSRASPLLRVSASFLHSSSTDALQFRALFRRGDDFFENFRVNVVGCCLLLERAREHNGAYDCDQKQQASNLERERCVAIKAAAQALRVGGYFHVARS